jgi:hypothetical protein
MRLLAAVISLLIPSEPGGNYDLVGRLMARHLGKHLAGNPVVTPQNMPGAGGLIVANHLYNIAPRDGSVLGLVQGSVIQDQALGNPGARFDANKFSWIGTPTREAGVTIVWNTGGKMFGAASVRHVAYGRLGGFQVVKGYKSGPSILLALERREIDAMNIYTWREWGKVRPEWVRDGKIQKAPPLPDTPVVRFLRAGDDLGRPLAAPPGTDVNELRAAFHYMLKDPAFLLDAQVMDISIEPTSGGELGGAVRGLLATPTGAVDAFKAITAD